MFRIRLLQALLLLALLTCISCKPSLFDELNADEKEDVRDFIRGNVEGENDEGDSERFADIERNDGSEGEDDRFEDGDNNDYNDDIERSYDEQRTYDDEDPNDIEDNDVEDSSDNGGDGAVTDRIEQINRKAFKKSGKNEPFEGDIDLARGEDPTKRDGSSNSRRDAVIHNHRKWPKSTKSDFVYIPYAFDRWKPVTGADFAGAFREFHQKTCVRFIPRWGHSKYINFYKGTGCHSKIGLQSYGGSISIGNGCGSKGIIIHELYHALGFWHEQSRLDRDHYVRINWHNIQNGKAHNFNKYKVGEATTFGYSYDRLSIMQYGRTAFSKNGQNTIEWRANKWLRLGGSVLTDTDVAQMNKLYRCPYWKCGAYGWFNYRHKMCCKGVLRHRPANSLCCGTYSMNYKTQFCWAYRVYNRCNGKKYNPWRQFCYWGRWIFSKLKCGTAYYVWTTHFCHKGRIYSKCGGKVYNPSTQNCYFNKIHPKLKWIPFPFGK